MYRPDTIFRVEIIIINHKDGNISSGMVSEEVIKTDCIHSLMRIIEHRYDMKIGILHYLVFKGYYGFQSKDVTISVKVLSSTNTHEVRSN